MASKKGKRKRRRNAPQSSGAVATAPRPKPAKRSERVATSPPKAEPQPRGRRFDVRRGIERPPPIWAPIPVTEIVTALGLGLFVLGFLSGGPMFIAVGALLATLAIAELCAREHFSAFKSHTLLLSFMPVVLLHSVMVFAIWDGWVGPIAFAVDAALFGALAAWLYDRYRKALARARVKR